MSDLLIVVFVTYVGIVAGVYAFLLIALLPGTIKQYRQRATYLENIEKAVKQMEQQDSDR